MYRTLRKKEIQNSKFPPKLGPLEMPLMFNIMGSMKGDGSVGRGSKSVCGSIWISVWYLPIQLGNGSHRKETLSLFVNNNMPALIPKTRAQLHIVIDFSIHPTVLR